MLEDKNQENAGNVALSECKDCDRIEIFKESQALVFYLAQHGNILTDDNEIEKHFIKLSKLVSKFQNNTKTFTARDWENLIQAYANVSSFTYGKHGVNGRTVLDTLVSTKTKPPNKTNPPKKKQPHKSSDLSSLTPLYRLLVRPKRHQRSLTTALWLLFLAFFLQISAGWASRISDPILLSDNCRFLYYLIHDSLPLLLPAVWGSIGSCVFLMKRITDKLFVYAYEEAKLRGNGTRILLGAILGILVVQLFFPNIEENLFLGEIRLGPMTIAFVAGLGVKPVYTAFEVVVEAISKRISGQNPPSV